MSRGLNKVMIIGHLGRDPEMRALPSGQQVANFSLATSRRYKDRDGNRKDETEWHNIVVFGKQAEIAGQYLTKGKMVFVEGRIQTRSWDDKESGKKQYKTEIICDNFQMLGSKGDGGGGGQRDSGTSAPSGGGHDGGGGGDFQDDDIPF